MNHINRGALALSAGSPLAADLPARKAPVLPPSAPIWTGFYVGLNAGGVFGNNAPQNPATSNVYRDPGNAD